MGRNLIRLTLAGVLVVALGLTHCGGGGGSSPTSSPETYVVFAWNDLGMHCLNPTYDQAVILPPYNTVWAQVVRKGNPPQVVTSGISVSYSILNNTRSADKRSYGQFWTNCLKLFGITLVADTGLNLEDPALHNGLSGAMVLKGDHFQVNGIPVTPVNDSGVWSPYQVAQITVKDAAGNTVAQTRATVPTSDEINCAKCHGANAMADVLSRHDAAMPLHLADNAPVLCASCHGSPALGTSGAGYSGKYLSEAIHGYHADKAGITCYDCHPGATTQCNRSLRHTDSDGNCVVCHGDMAQVASSITSGGRIPWASEPQCATCHNATVAIAEVDTGATLYRNARGHGGLGCAACHGSPHAMAPSRESSDNYQMNQYMGSLSGASDPLRSMGSCGVCHDSSKPDSAADFAEEHGSGRASACSVCHTGFTDAATSSKWPHAFQWKAR